MQLSHMEGNETQWQVQIHTATQPGQRRARVQAGGGGGMEAYMNYPHVLPQHQQGQAQPQAQESPAARAAAGAAEAPCHKRRS